MAGCEVTCLNQHSQLPPALASSCLTSSPLRDLLALCLGQGKTQYPPHHLLTPHRSCLLNLTPALQTHLVLISCISLSISSAGWMPTVPLSVSQREHLLYERPDSECRCGRPFQTYLFRRDFSVKHKVKMQQITQSFCMLGARRSIFRRARLLLPMFVTWLIPLCQEQNWNSSGAFILGWSVSFLFSAHFFLQKCRVKLQRSIIDEESSVADSRSRSPYLVRVYFECYFWSICV